MGFALIGLVLAYTTLDNIWQRPDGVKIGACFIVAIVLVSLLSRAARALELRAIEIVYDARAEAFLRDCARRSIRLVANEPDGRGDRGVPREDPADRGRPRPAGLR